MRPPLTRHATPAGRSRSGRSGPRARRSELQLELFPAEPAPRAARPPAPPSPARPAAGARPRLAPAPGDGRDDLHRRLSRLLDGRLAALVLTDNRRTILSVRRSGSAASPALTLRLHRVFVGAPEEVLRSVATFATTGRTSKRSREALTVVREHFRRGRSERGGEAARRAPRRVALEPRGSAFDLRQVRDDLNQRYFDGRLAVDVTWGKAGGTVAHRCRGRRVKTSTIQLGSYSYEDNLIRVHRALDHPRVPRYVIESVVYHELLHAAMPPVVRNGRRYFHTPEFRRRERLFGQLEKAERWVERHLPELLAARERPRAPRPAR